MAREAYYEQKLRRGREDIVCPRCGSRLTIKGRWDKCICGYCDASLTRLSGKRFDYTDHSLTRLLVALICAGLMIPLTLVMINWPTIMMSKSDEIFNVSISDDESGAVDPFQEVTVTFSGYDGSAVAKVDNGLDGVDYKIETNANLRNGDVAVVRASSKQYTLLRSVREYPVMGLSVLVKDPNKLSTDLIEQMEQESRTVVTEKTLTGGDSGVKKKDKINKIKHHSIHVYPDDKNNTVFDIYSAVWHTTNDVDTPIYFVIKYKDLATSTDANGTHFTYDTATLCGTYSSPTRVGVPATDVAENHYMTGYFSLQEINEDLLDRQPNKNIAKIRRF